MTRNARHHGARETNLETRIADLLEARAHTVQQLADGLDSTYGATRVALDLMLAAGTVCKVGKEGLRKLYGLSEHRR
jgi:hypothetical protein